MSSDTKHPPTTDMAHILSQNLESAEQIKATAGELDVVHAVLSTKIPTEALRGDLEDAVNRTDELEQKLNDTAIALDKSNEQLQRHIADNPQK